MNKNYKIGFTLAEVLITLAIIGVVAALTIPSVISSYNDKKYNTARLKALKTFGEAGKMASINGEINGQPTAKDFVNNVLSKYLKIVKMCYSANECNFPEYIQPSDPTANKLNSDNLNSWSSLGLHNISGKNITSVDATNLSIYLILNDEFSVKLFYNPKCSSHYLENPGDKAACITDHNCWTYFVDDTCINVIYDMNGTKGPNHVGKDIGLVTVFWSGINVQTGAPGILPYAMNSAAPRKTATEASKYCLSKSNSKINISLPDINELTSLYINQRLTSMPSDIFWSGTNATFINGGFWNVNDSGGRGCWDGSLHTDLAWCVRR